MYCEMVYVELMYIVVNDGRISICSFCVGGGVDTYGYNDNELGKVTL